MKIAVLGDSHLGQIVKELLRKNHEISGNLNNKDYIIIAYDIADRKGKVDLSQLNKGINQIKKSKAKSTVIVLSQIPVGTSRQIQKSLKLPVIYIPENIKKTSKVKDFINTPVLVIGSDKEKLARKVNSDLFRKIKGEKAFVSLETAEMWKHSMNAYLSTMIVLGNSIGRVCKHVNADVSKIIELMKLDPRISDKAPINPGPAFAGNTLSRDLVTLSKVAKKSNMPDLFNVLLKYNPKVANREAKK